MTDTNVNLSAVVDRLHESGMLAAVENTGGGVMCITASSAGSRNWSCMIGPGWTEEGLVLGDTVDLYVTPYDHDPDADPDGVLVTTVPSGAGVADIVALAQDECARSETVQIAAGLLRAGITAEQIIDLLERVA